MKFLVVILLLSIVGQIASAPASQHGVRQDEESDEAQSDEDSYEDDLGSDEEYDDSPYGGGYPSTNDIPSAGEVSYSPYGDGNPSSYSQVSQDEVVSGDIQDDRTFRDDDDSDEEEDDEEGSDEILGDVQYISPSFGGGPGPSYSESPEGGSYDISDSSAFRALIRSGMVSSQRRVSSNRRVQVPVSVSRYQVPVSSRRVQMNRVPVSSVSYVQRPMRYGYSYGRPMQAYGYPVRRVSSYAGVQSSPRVVMSRPTVYRRPSNRYYYPSQSGYVVRQVGY